MQQTPRLAKGLFAALLSTSLASTAFLSAPAFAAPKAERFVVIIQDKKVGHLNADTDDAGKTKIDFDIKNNGRGPTIKEELSIGADGRPTAWNVTGTTTFGSKVAENFAISGTAASWTDAAGPQTKQVSEPSIYVAQSSSPWALGLYARALLKDADQSMPALPGGVLKLTKGETLTVNSTTGTQSITAYDLTGIDMDPQTMLLDDKGELFGIASPGFLLVREGFEGEDKRLRDLAEKWEAERFSKLQKQFAHNYAKPVRINNVRLFDPAKQALTGPVSVLVKGDRIAAIGKANAKAKDEVTIDGAGGTLVPGMYEMHGHLGQDDAMLNVLAGITSVRDKGNRNDVLDTLITRIEKGEIAGPRVVREGFIEGKSPFNSNNGILVDSQDAAVKAVDWYADQKQAPGGGYWGVKIYNSINPEWVPAMIKRAHERGLKVSGHVPAFGTTDGMLEAGYDEMTHINQFMLSWVLKPGEDTRQLLRLTALKRFENFDMNDPRVQKTIDIMVKGKKAIDPTLEIHEMLTQNRDGIVPPGATDYIEHLPVGTRRGMLKAMIDASKPEDDKAYRAAFDKILATVKLLHDKGVTILPGTDLGGSFTYHRELELYTRAGFTPAEVLKMATLTSADYLGQGKDLGSIEAGKYADFFLVPGDPTKDLKTIKALNMVAKGGTFYYPSEAYPAFGVQPFSTKPKVSGE